MSDAYRPSFAPYLEDVANSYAALADQSDAALQIPVLAAWRDLGADAVDRAAGIRLLLSVSETGDPEPYASAADMVADIDAGNFLVSTANSDHPLWTDAENVAFRIVHDVLGHYAASVAAGWHNEDRCDYGCRLPRAATCLAGFDWRGEIAACEAHRRLLPKGLGPRAALYTECLAQTGYAIARGGFGPQYVGFPAAKYLPGGAANAWIDWIWNV